MPGRIAKVGSPADGRARRVPGIPEGMRRTALVLGVWVAAACGDAGGDMVGGSTGGGSAESGPASEGPDGSEGGSDGTTGPSGETTVGASDDASSGGEDSSDTSDTTDPPIDPPAACDELELPARDGAEIRVSPAGDGVVMVEGMGEMTLRAAVSWPARATPCSSPTVPICCRMRPMDRTRGSTSPRPTSRFAPRVATRPRS